MQGIGSRHENHEFITAVSADDVDVLTQLLRNLFGKFHEHIIPDHMAEGIVDILEIIDVHEDDAEISGRAFHLGHLFVGPDFEIPANVHSGEAVKNRHFKEAHVFQGEGEDRGQDPEPLYGFEIRCLFADVQGDQGDYGL